MTEPDPIVLVGGGLVGLAVGWRLAQAGRRVVVVDRDAAHTARPSGAWWAAAGMLAPVSEAGWDEPDLLALARASLALYPAFAAELQAATGIDIGLRTEGTLIVAAGRDDTAWLRRHWEYQRELGLPVEWLDGDEARDREPHLAAGVTAAVWAAGDHQVDNRALGRALRGAFLGAGGKLLDGMEVVAVEHPGNRATGVRVRAAADPASVPVRLGAAAVVLCGGAWSRLLAESGLPAAAVPPVRPVKGQLLSLEMGPMLTLRHTVRARRVYLVPKADGRLVVGATVEEVGFDTRMTAGAMLDLLREAWEVVPGLYDLPLLDHWAGLRPVSRDRAPILGATVVDGLYLATGHGRNGVLLAPATADAMRDILLGGEVPDALRPFLPDRFGDSAARSPNA